MRWDGANAVPGRPVRSGPVVVARSTAFGVIWRPIRNSPAICSTFVPPLRGSSSGVHFGDSDETQNHRRRASPNDRRLTHGAQRVKLVSTETLLGIGALYGSATAPRPHADARGRSAVTALSGRNQGTCRLANDR